MINAPPKDDPTSAESPAKIEPTVTGNTDTKKRPAVTRNREAKKPTAATGNGESSEPSETAKAPTKKTAQKPPTVTGYFWRDDGAGWELRKSIMVEGKRKQPYVAHLSRSAFAEMKRRHRGAALDAAIMQWIAEKDTA